MTHKWICTLTLLKSIELEMMCSDAKFCLIFDLWYIFHICKSSPSQQCCGHWAMHSCMMIHSCSSTWGLKWWLASLLKNHRQIFNIALYHLNDGASSHKQAWHRSLARQGLARTHTQLTPDPLLPVAVTAMLYQGQVNSSMEPRAGFCSRPGTSIARINSSGS